MQQSENALTSPLKQMQMGKVGCLAIFTDLLKSALQNAWNIYSWIFVISRCLYSILMNAKILLCRHIIMALCFVEST